MRSRRPYYFLAVLSLPILFLLQNPRITEPVHGLSLTLLKPALAAGQSAADFVSAAQHAVIHFWRTFQNQGRMEARVAELEAGLVRFQEMAKENQRLMKLVEFRETLSGKTVTARVIGRDLAPWRKTVILDKGKNQGIKKDMAVMVPEGLVGRVLEAGPGTSRVILLTDPEARVSALTDQSRAQGVVTGDGSAVLKMVYLELDSGAAVEETVLSLGAGRLYPKGLRIGKITGLGKDEDGLHLVAYVHPFVPFSKLEEVLCLGSDREK